MNVKDRRMHQLNEAISGIKVSHNVIRACVNVHCIYPDYTATGVEQV